MGRKNKVAFRKRLHRERSRRPKSRLKPTSAVFWLKRKYQTWERSEYADNLISYLNGASTCRTITLSELSNVLHGISGKSGKQSTCSGEHDNTLSIGERSSILGRKGFSVVAWCGWSLWWKRIPLVSYMINDSEWVFPEKAEILKTTVQIIARKVPVDYK